MTEIERLRAELDAAQARVAELEKQEPEFWYRDDGDGGVEFTSPCDGFARPLYAAPVAQAGQVQDIDTMVSRFLSWPLPDEVCADPCASTPFTPNRFGTNLLNWEQAKEMLTYVVAAAPAQGDGIDHAWCDGVCDD